MSRILKGTTPTLTFKLKGALPSDFADFVITIRQRGNVVVQKKKADCTCYEDTVQAQLTQEETRSFRNGIAVVQIRGITPGGSVHASDVLEFDAEAVLDDEILEVAD